MEKVILLPALKQIADQLLTQEISLERKKVLTPLIEYIQKSKEKNLPIQLNFICTHNSRRSQFSQIWAQTAADYYGIDVSCFSGGVEVTAFNNRAVASIERSGFKVLKVGNENPLYSIYNSENGSLIKAFSKLYNDEINPSSHFAAVMTCSHADENCPFIIGADDRIAVRYEDPKAFDDTNVESEKYDERSIQIAGEMFYVFSQIK